MAGVMAAAKSYWASVACSSKLDLELRRLTPGRLLSSEFAPGESGLLGCFTDLPCKQEKPL